MPKEVEALKTKQKFAELKRGLKAFYFGYLMSGNFRIDEAMSEAARIAYLVAKILVRVRMNIRIFALLFMDIPEHIDPLYW